MAEARSSSSGMITFGMVSVPVRLYPMISDKSVRFNNLHAVCGGRTKSPTHCPACAVDVETSELVKGISIGGQVVQLTPEDLESLPLTSSKAIEITGFVDEDDVPFYRFDHSYFLGPDDRQKVGQRAFQLLHPALVEAGKCGIARMARSGKESLVIIRPAGRVLALSHLHWQAEVNDVAAVEETLDKTELSETERQMAVTLVGAMPDAGDDLVSAEDGYRAAVDALVETKLQGGTIQPIAAPAPPMLDLVAALKASLEAANAKRELAPKAKARKGAA